MAKRHTIVKAKTTISKYRCEAIETLAKRIAKKYKEGKYQTRLATQEELARWSAGINASQVRAISHEELWISQTKARVIVERETHYDAILCVIINDELWLVNGNHTCKLSLELLMCRDEDPSLDFISAAPIMIIDAKDWIQGDPAEVELLMIQIGNEMNNEPKRYVTEKRNDNVKFQLTRLYKNGIDIEDPSLWKSLASSVSMFPYQIRDIAYKILRDISKNQRLAEAKNFRQWKRDDLKLVEKEVISWYSKNKLGAVSPSIVVLDWDVLKLHEGCGKSQFMAFRENKRPFIIFHLKSPDDVNRLEDYFELIRMNGSIRSPDKSWFDYVILNYNKVDCKIFDQEQVKIHINGKDLVVKAKKK